MARWKTLSAVVFLTALMGGWEGAEVEARGFRVNMMPHGNVAGCNTCHTTGGGSELNAFGLAVRTRVSPGGNEVFWDAAMAALDSDGDGFTNGQELQDPNGTWRSGQQQPGNASLVTQPQRGQQAAASTAGACGQLRGRAEEGACAAEGCIYRQFNP